MKTVIVDFSGDYGPGDLVMVSHSSPRGGRNTCRHVVQEGEGGEEIARAFATMINGGTGEFNPGNFEAGSDGEMLQIMCNDGAGHVSISASVDGGRKIQVDEL